MKRYFLGVVSVVLVLGILGSAMFWGKDIKLAIESYFVPDVVSLEAQCETYLNQIDELYAEIWQLKGELGETDRKIKWQERFYKDREKIWEGKISDLSLQIDELDKQRLKLIEKLRGEIIGWDGLKDFKSMNELLSFLAQTNIYELWYVPDDLDCDDYTQLLQRTAAEAGYRMSPVWMLIREGNNIVAWHTMNYAIVEDYIEGQGKIKWVVVIEPQSNEIVVLGAVDRPETWREKLVDWLP